MASDSEHFPRSPIITRQISISSKKLPLKAPEYSQKPYEKQYPQEKNETLEEKFSEELLQPPIKSKPIPQKRNHQEGEDDENQGAKKFLNHYCEKIERVQSLADPLIPKAQRLSLAEIQNSPNMKASLDSLYNEATSAGYFSIAKVKLASNHLLERAARKAKLAIKNYKDSLLATMQAHIEDMYLPTPLNKKYEKQRAHVESSKMGIEKLNTSVTVSGKYWFKSGIRGSEVRGISSYEKISKQLAALSEKVPDQMIAQTIWELVRDEEITHKYLFTENQLNLIGKITYLLFAVEPHRHETSLIINAMFLDMVMDNICNMNFIQNLPMSIKGAKGHIRQWKILTKESYDQPLKTDPKLLDSLGGKFFARHIDLVTLWAKNNMGIEYLEHKHLQNFGVVINAKIEDWFGVKIKPPKFTLEAPEDSEVNSEAFSDLGLSPLALHSEEEEMENMGDSETPYSLDC